MITFLLLSLAILTHLPFLNAAAIKSSPSNIFAKRQGPTCDAALGNPPVGDCMNALALMPNDAAYGLFVRNDVVPPPGQFVAAYGGPWFFQIPNGHCVIGVYIQHETDETSWIALQGIASSIISSCVHNAGIGGYADSGQSNGIRTFVWEQDHPSDADTVHDSSSNETQSCEWEDIVAGNYGAVESCSAEVNAHTVTIGSGGGGRRVRKQ